MADAGSLHLKIKVDGAFQASTTLSAFLADNVDGIDPAEAQAITDRLLAGQPYRGGGGAAPVFDLIPDNELEAGPEPRSGLRREIGLQLFCLADEPHTLTDPSLPLGHLLAAMGDKTYVDIRAVGYTRDREADPRPMVIVTVNKATILMTPGRAAAEAKAMTAGMAANDPAFKRALVIRSAFSQAAARAGTL